MDAPLLVLRQSVPGQPAVPGVVTTLSLPELLDWYHNAMATMRLALSKDPQADGEVRATFQDALRAGPQKGQATIYAYLLWDAYQREQAMRAQAAQAAASEPPPPPAAPVPDPGAPAPPVEAVASSAPGARSRVVNGCVPQHDPGMMCPDCDDGGGV